MLECVLCHGSYQSVVYVPMNATLVSVGSSPPPITGKLVTVHGSVNRYTGRKNPRYGSMSRNSTGAINNDVITYYMYHNTTHKEFSPYLHL